MRILSTLALLAFPFAAFAAGSDDTAPPTPTETTTQCKEGQVWDEKTKACVLPDDARLDDDTRFRAVRELAWAGRPETARLGPAAGDCRVAGPNASRGEDDHVPRCVRL